MPLPFYMSVKGSKQGNISDKAGEQLGHENEILCQSFHHDVQIPTDISTGLAAGKRVHGPMNIIKNIDRTSPMLYSALVSNELLTEVVIKHYKTDPTGTLQNHFTVKLENAIIKAIRASAPNYLDQTKEQFTYTEEVSFTYQKISWLWVDGGIESYDEWMVA